MVCRHPGRIVLPTTPFDTPFCIAAGQNSPNGELTAHTSCPWSPERPNVTGRTPCRQRTRQGRLNTHTRACLRERSRTAGWETSAVTTASAAGDIRLLTASLDDDAYRQPTVHPIVCSMMARNASSTQLTCWVR